MTKTEFHKRNTGMYLKGESEIEENLICQGFSIDVPLKIIDAESRIRYNSGERIKRVPVDLDKTDRYLLAISYETLQNLTDRLKEDNDRYSLIMLATVDRKSIKIDRETNTLSYNGELIFNKIRSTK
ncbi:MAG: hypothetical protein U9P44_03505 [archaeon]|nr:hypothetical protein [archaeon]